MSLNGNLLLYRRAGSGLSKRELRSFAVQLRDRVAGGRPFLCLLTDDRELERLNRMFLGQSYATDVLSFPSAGEEILGELAISVERAKSQAEEYGHSSDDELRILMLHGILHLTGMNHQGDRGAMARAEKRWRIEFGLPGGLIERSKRNRA
ncbi:MAG: rRNA maturation RNase YbeY [Bryobacteraceae bacterium]|nr:rRNA maturation RNase YbeY [Bryobacteraceae bacterium]